MTFLYDSLPGSINLLEEKNGNYLLEQLKILQHQLMETYETTIQSWLHALELHDGESREHAFRVSEMTVKFARYLGIKEPRIFHIRNGALLHDIGKIGIPVDILNKGGPLSDTEWEVVRRHPTLAYELLAPIPFLKPALEIPFYHHERWDGHGYPNGLQGEQIPLTARIFSIVDVWDALRYTRPYRNESWSEEKIITHIKQQSSHHFDPEIVTAFINYFSETQSG
ncbi:MAG TPA: HD-GYP domain-containing protein [Anaerolineales bacterium]|nr:HD-GYP domain-containing protein [Anaerolineales bacterium]